mmetsp:Transcript_3834/g.10771  ORF Transcript_3834/g.10771 Transcript_3834/m.10771 type:complete len:229 (-) Transcript_3834:1910-2596(-)
MLAQCFAILGDDPLEQVAVSRHGILQSLEHIFGGLFLVVHGVLHGVADLIEIGDAPLSLRPDGVKYDPRSDARSPPVLIHVIAAVIDPCGHRVRCLVGAQCFEDGGGFLGAFPNAAVHIPPEVGDGAVLRYRNKRCRALAKDVIDERALLRQTVLHDGFCGRAVLPESGNRLDEKFATAAEFVGRHFGGPECPERGGPLVVRVCQVEGKPRAKTFPCSRRQRREVVVE